MNNAGMYYVTITDEEGCSDVTSTTVVVNENPVASIGNDQVRCEGQPLYLSAFGGDYYEWNGPNDFYSTDQYPVIDRGLINLKGKVKAVHVYSVPIG